MSSYYYTNAVKILRGMLSYVIGFQMIFHGEFTCACVNKTLLFLRCVNGNCIAAAAVATETADAALSALDDNPDI